MELILLALLLVVFVVVPLLGMRKQNQRLREINSFQESLRVGMVVKTTSGIHGRVNYVGDTTVDLEISPGVQTTWDKATVLELVGEPEADLDVNPDIQPKADLDAGSSAGCEAAPGISSEASLRASGREDMAGETVGHTPADAQSAEQNKPVQRADENTAPAVEETPLEGSQEHKSTEER